MKRDVYDMSRDTRYDMVSRGRIISGHIGTTCPRHIDVHKIHQYLGYDTHHYELVPNTSIMYSITKVE